MGDTQPRKYFKEIYKRTIEERGMFSKSLHLNYLEDIFRHLLFPLATRIQLTTSSTRIEKSFSNVLP